MYELWNMLSETGLSDEAKRCICRGMLKGMQRRALIHDGIEAVDRVIVEDACAIPAKEPENPVFDMRIWECDACHHPFIAGNVPPKYCSECGAKYPTCPPKPEVEGLDDILGDIQTDECNQHMHDEAKRRIVEAVCKLYSEWGKAFDGRTFVADIEKWGGIQK